MNYIFLFTSLIAMTTAGILSSLYFNAGFHMVQYGKIDPPRFVDLIMDETVTDGETPVCSGEDRALRVRSMCDRGEIMDYRGLSDHMLEHVTRYMIVDDTHRLIYCCIQKSGSTTWKALLANNSDASPSKKRMLKTHDAHVIHRVLPGFKLRRMKTYNRSEIITRLDTYYKLVVVRHPVVRLLSGYNDKLTGQYPRLAAMYMEKSKIIGKELNNHNLSFAEFLAFLVEHEDQYVMGNPHFTSLESHCDPCIIPFDYVARAESGTVDKEYISRNKLSGFGVPNVYSKYGKHHAGASVVKTLSEFRDVPQYIRAKLTDIVAKDMTLFGYSFSCTEAECEASCMTKNGCC